MNSFSQRLGNYYLRHLQAACNSLGQLSRAPFASFITCLVIAITLALPSSLFVGLKNIDGLRTHIQQTTQVTLYLKNSITENQALNLTHTLQTKKIISKAYAISPETGLKELQKNAGFQGAFDALADNPLPWSIVIIPNIANNNAHALDQLTQELKQLPYVDEVQSDLLWVKRFGTFIQLAKQIVFSIAILLSVAVLLIVNNSIRSATQRYQKEIDVIKLIGGTNAFIRRPFLYAGLFYGLLGGILAWFLVDILLHIANGPTQQFASLYHSSFNLAGLGWNGTVSLFACGMSLGLLGAWLAVKTPLKTPK